MRKEKDFGVDYKENRSGEWEYAAYRPDKSVLTAPQFTNPCAACHLKQAGEANDFVFRMNLFFDKTAANTKPTPPENTVIIANYAFFPQKLTVKVGTTMTWINQDEAEHTIHAKDGSFQSEVLKSVAVKAGEQFTFKFDKTGSYEYSCHIHPAMVGSVEVIE